MKNAVIISDRPSLSVQLRFAIARFEAATDITELGLSDEEIQLAENKIADANIVILVLPDSVDTATKLIQNLRRLTTTRLVAVGTVTSPQHLLKYMHSGADDFIDENEELATKIKESVTRITRVDRDDNPRSSPLITVMGAFGGSGATLTAANLSILLARRFDTCGLLDLTGGYGDLVNHLDLRPRYSIKELCTNVEELDSEMFNNAITEHVTGVKVLAGSTAVDRSSFPGRDAVRGVVDVARSTLPCVVADLNRKAPFATDLVNASDVVVLLTGLNYSSAYATRRLLADWKNEGVNTDKTLVVANRCRRRGELGVDETAVILGRSISLSIKDDALAANVSVNCGNPAVDESPGSELARDMQSLFVTTMHALDGCGAPGTRSNPRLLAGCLSRLTKFASATFN